MEAPIAALGTKVDQSGDDLRAARENLADLTRRMANLDNKLADISSAVRTMSTHGSGASTARCNQFSSACRLCRIIRTIRRYGG